MQAIRAIYDGVNFTPKQPIPVKGNYEVEITFLNPVEPTDFSKTSISEIIKRKNIPRKPVEVNAEGHIVVDKDKDPELYDWAVNG